MKIESMILLANRMSVQRKFPELRQLILREWERIIETKNYQMLNDNAKQFVKIIQQEKETGIGINNTLTNTEKKIIQLINESINEVKLPFAKRLFLQHRSLFEKQEAQYWLTANSKFVCNAWCHEEPADQEQESFSENEAELI
ncbi:hypothetical protein [Neobacillus terrae]|uniref:hypothetical protein n=1 Tax=Neobacillus terrae TaxID=3034837 RepID=UPI00140D4613|nr:hypothetical protein [Neobacillus terrae]NHM32618.1 hypothetical protein [Neobacillus terrae]